MVILYYNIDNISIYKIYNVVDNILYKLYIDDNVILSYNKIATKRLIVGDKEIYVTLIYWSGGGSVSEGKYYEWNNDTTRIDFAYCMDIKEITALLT